MYYQTFAIKHHPTQIPLLKYFKWLYHLNKSTVFKIGFQHNVKNGKDKNVSQKKKKKKKKKKTIWSKTTFLAKKQQQTNENDMPEIHVTEIGVLKLLMALNISKAAGPDGIRLRVLKELSSEIAPPYSSFQGISAPTISSRHL